MSVRYRVMVAHRGIQPMLTRGKIYDKDDEVKGNHNNDEKDDEKYDYKYDAKDDDGTLWNLSNLNEGKVVCSSMSLVLACQQSIVER